MKQEVGSEVGSEILVWRAQRPQRAPFYKRHCMGAIANVQSPCMAI